MASFDQASTDQRFSVAVAAFGQKLRDEDATAKFGYDKIMEIATAARGADPFGYRSEFLSLVRLASALAAVTGSGDDGRFLSDGIVLIAGNRPTGG